MIQRKQVSLFISILLILLFNVSCKRKIKQEIFVKKETEVKPVIKQVSKVYVDNLTRDKFDSLLNSGIIDNIDYNGDLVSCYKIVDKSGGHYLILTHDYTKNIIYFYYAEQEAFGVKLIWSISDSVVQTDYSEEYDIYFLKNYIHVADFDNDDLVDIILVYKTNSKEDYDRLKIRIFHKDSKVLINHKGASLDDERETKIDQSFYSLPKSIRQQVFLDIKEINVEVLSINSDVLKKIGVNLY